MKVKLQISKEKWNELKNQLRPGQSWWALIGIVLFFFVPEIIAFFWGDSIKKYFQMHENMSSSLFYKKLYHTLQSLGENSWFNIILGIVFVIWFFYEKKTSKSQCP